MPDVTSNPSPANFTVYVAPLDPVGNFAGYSNGASLLNQTGQQYHFGTVVPLGTASERAMFQNAVQDFVSSPVTVGNLNLATPNLSKLGDLAVIVAGVSEHRLEYYQYNVPNNAAPDAIAPATQAQIAAASTSDDSLDVLTVADIFMGGGVAIDPNTIAITANPDQTTNVSLTSTDGTRSGIASYDVNGNLQGGATVGPQWDELYGVLPDFSQSSKQILVDQGSTVAVTGSTNELYVSVPLPQEGATTYLTLVGNDDTVASTNSGDVVMVSGSGDAIVNQGVTNTFSSEQSAPVAALGDTSIFEAAGRWSGTTTVPADGYSNLNIKVLEDDGSALSTFHETISNGSSSNADSITSIGLYGSNGLEYESVPFFNDGTVDGTVNAYGDNDDVATASYGSEDGGSTSSLASVSFSSTTGDWNSASLSFIHNTQTASSIFVSGSFGSDDYISNDAGAGDQPTEIFKNSDGVETESISTGTFTDPSTGDLITSTEVTTYSGKSSTTSIYKSGDSNAPTF